MKQKLLVIPLLLAGVSVFSILSSFATTSAFPPSLCLFAGLVAPAASFISTQTSKVSEFEVIRAAADAFVSIGKVTRITAKELYANLTDGKEPNNPFILCVYESNSELPDLYAKGHITGAIKRSWGLVFKEEEFLVQRGGYSRASYLAKLPKDRQIVVYSYNGHIGNQVTALLNILGYDAVNLKWGMASWTLDKDAAPGRYDESKDCKAQRIDTTMNEPAERYSFPIVENTASEDEHEIIRAAAEAYAGSGKIVNISAEELFERQRDRNAAAKPFILSVDEADIYTKGHILGAVNIPWRAVFRKENLSKLPNDKQILVCSYDGHTSSQVAALLNILGYDCVNLRWGMASWTFNNEIAPGRYNEVNDCMNYSLASGPLPFGETGYY